MTKITSPWALTNYEQTFKSYVKKSDIKSYFDKGDLVTEVHTNNFISSSLNTQETNHQFLRMKEGSLCLASGSNDPFHETCPPMVPNLQHNIRVYSLDKHSIMHQGVLGEGTATTHIWAFDPDGDAASCTANSGNSSLLYSAIQLQTHSDTDDETAVYTAQEPFQCAASSSWWVKTRFVCSKHAEVEFAFGLVESDGNVTDLHNESAGAGNDRIIFVKDTHNNDAVKYRLSKDSTNVGPTAFDPGIEYNADKDVMSLGIHWNGTDIKFFSNVVATGTDPGPMTLVHTHTNSAHISDTHMRLIFYVRNGASSAQNVVLEYLQGAILNNTISVSGL